MLMNLKKKKNRTLFIEIEFDQEIENITKIKAFQNIAAILKIKSIDSTFYFY